MTDLHLQPVVMDVGSLTTKVGFAGGTAPKYTYDSILGRIKHRRVIPGGALEKEASGKGRVEDKDVYCGQSVSNHPGAFTLSQPVSYNGAVESHSDLHTLVNHGMAKLNVLSASTEHPVLLTENPTAVNLVTNRCSLAEFMFEYLNSPAIFFGPAGVLSLYSTGKTTGVVLDIGDSGCQVTPIYEGLGLHHSILGSSIGGRRTTDVLQKLLTRSTGLSLTTSAEYQMVRRMKEECCYVQVEGAEGGDAAWLLPDGTPVTLPARLRTQPSEVLFSPSDHTGSEELGVHRLLHRSVMSCDIDVRSRLFESIELVGGGTMMTGLPERVLKEVRSLSPPHTTLRLSATPERKNAAWVGGSILASLSTFKGMWISKERWREEGENCMRDAML
ncbi:hypothetical protein TrRE_jg12520 [Triparma retinervis]|uniref:Actin-like protein n=1 Tax=Triparma retinervis TaxID=2557542 RepID=A0A9W6ZC35_9STRA|nr:hypothetical protein TrRE_jg12520 [Triparma retinervis]